MLKTQVAIIPQKLPYESIAIEKLIPIMAKILNALKPCNANTISMQNTAVNPISNDGGANLLLVLRAPLIRVTKRWMEAKAHKAGKFVLNPRYCVSLVS
jgi:hypothetical protein